MSGDVLQGRELFGRRAWGQAFDELSAAEVRFGLDVADVERLASCAYLIGRVDESAGAWERACLAQVRRDETVEAARRRRGERGADGAADDRVGMETMTVQASGTDRRCSRCEAELRSVSRSTCR
jgi:hypothetical protein